MNEYIYFWKRGTQFRGVSSRAEFWIPAAVNTVIILVLDFISRTFLGWDESSFSLSNVFLLVILIPSITNGVRRLHDTNRSGWWYVAMVIPIANLIAIAVLCLDTVYVDNRHRAYNREMGWDVKYPEKDGQYWKYYDESSFAGDLIDDERKDNMG